MALAAPRRRSNVICAVVSGVIAVVATILLVSTWNDVGPNDWQGWRYLSPAATASAWMATWAWVTERRLLAVPFHLGSLFAPWGYLYPVPLVAIVLAVFAGASFRSSGNSADPAGEAEA